MAAAYATEVVVGLAGADHRPLEIAEGLPVANPLRVERLTARSLVCRQKLVEGPDARDRPVVVAESPRADAEPAEVLGRIAEMRQLPVDHRREAVLVDDEVAEPE